LYQLRWVDPDVPLSESVLGLARLQQEGKIRLIGFEYHGQTARRGAVNRPDRLSAEPLQRR
jgi:aryl-alcohol dehydrogenase-like predicted oxidoreductase